MYLHVYHLLKQEMKLATAKLVQSHGVLDQLIELLDASTQCLASCTNTSAAGGVETPKWIAPLLLILDLYEKMAVASTRRAELEKIVVCYILGRGRG